MKNVMFAVVMAVLVLGATGCHRRADYLEPKTDNSVLKNVGRVITVLCPLGTAGNILVSEIIRDTERCDGTSCQSGTSCCEAPVVKGSCGCDK